MRPKCWCRGHADQRSRSGRSRGLSSGFGSSAISHSSCPAIGGTKAPRPAPRCGASHRAGWSRCPMAGGQSHLLCREDAASSGVARTWCRGAGPRPAHPEPVDGPAAVGGRVGRERTDPLDSGGCGAHTSSRQRMGPRADPAAQRMHPIPGGDGTFRAMPWRTVPRSRWTIHLATLSLCLKPPALGDPVALTGPDAAFGVHAGVDSGGTFGRYFRAVPEDPISSESARTARAPPGAHRPGLAGAVEYRPCH